jgi:hypothetical protein
MSVTQSGNKTHDQNCNLAEALRQVSVTAAAGNAATIKAAELAFFRTCRDSALANGCSPSVFIQAIRSLTNSDV